MSKLQDTDNNGELIHNFYVPQDKDYGINFEADPGKTLQEYRDECDINVLMARYEKSGVISNLSNASPRYLDLGDADALDLQHAMQVMNAAEAAFMSLPAKVRAEFENDAMSFVEYAENPENSDQLREWGLLKPKEMELAPTKVVIVPGEAPLDPAVQAGSKPAAPGAGEKP